ncbi:MAG: L-rhamnose/proton symporter RhaT [Bacteroidota bacterium]
MDQNVIIGLGYAVIAGVFAGSFSLPMKFTNGWKWQQNWMVYTVWSTLLMPIIFAAFTVPHLGEIYQQADLMACGKVVLLGMAWGVGSVCFGLGLEYLGVALGMSIMLGLIISIGTLIPIVLYHPEELTSAKGIKIIIASLILTIGVIVNALAGAMRDKKNNIQKENKTKSSSRFKTGLIIAVLAGILGNMSNIAFISGSPIKDLAVKAGASSAFAGNAVWPLVLFGGFLINFAYCAYLITKNKEWSLFATKKRWYWVLLAISGIVWFFCMMFFGMSSDKLGKLGASIGWASFQSLAIITGNLVGVFTGEWKNSGLKPILINVSGIVILMIGIYVIAFL